MTRLPSSFRHPILLLLAGALAACGGSPALEPTSPEDGGEGGAGGTSGPSGNGGRGGQIVDASSAVFVDRPIDLAPDLPPDRPPQARDLVPPDTRLPPEPGVVVATSCFQLPCQGLFLAAAACIGDDEMCQSQIVTQGEVVRTNYCLANGVKKLSIATSTDTGYMTSMRVSRQDGSACYTLDVSGTDASNIETLAWTAPTGAVLLTGTWNKTTDRLILTCEGTRYELPDLGCPGLEGEPGTTSCPAGTCPE